MALVNTLAGIKVLPKQTSAEPSDNYILSKEQLDFYEENGYLVIKQLIDFASLYSFKQRFVQICKGVVPLGHLNAVKEPKLAKVTTKREDYINKLTEVAWDDVFFTYAQNARLLSVLTQFLGEDITVTNSLFINKPPGASRHPAHQDLFYFPFRPAEKIIGCWTAVDHVNFDNGCLFVVPGSHKPKILYAHGEQQNTLKMYHGVDEDLAPVDKQVHLEMSPGDTVFFNPYLVHGSGPNTTKTYRKAITFHFASSSCHYIDVKNTVQEYLAKEVAKEAEKRGFTVDFADLWRIKSKQVKGIRSNL